MKYFKYIIIFICIFIISGCNKQIDNPNNENQTEEHVHRIIHHDFLDPTCTTSGHYEYDECEICDYTTYKEIPPLNHNYDNGVITKEPTCTNEGIKTYTCSRCGETYTEIINKIDHEYELIGIIDATYEEDGKKIYKCKLCGDEYYEVISKKEYLSLSTIIEKDQDISKWDIEITGFTTGSYGLINTNYLKLFFDMCSLRFQEQSENDKNDYSYLKQKTLSLIFEDGANYDVEFYFDLGVVRISKEIDGKVLYYYSYDSFDNYSKIESSYLLLSFIDKCETYEFNPCINLEEGTKYSLFEVLSYLLNSKTLLNVDDMAIFNLGETNSLLFKQENIKKMISFYEGEYEIIFNDTYYLDNINNNQRSTSFSYILDYYKPYSNPNQILNFLVVNVGMVIIDENDFGFPFTYLEDGVIKFATIKGCFTLEDRDIIGDLFYKLRDGEIKEAEESGLPYYDYWTKKYFEIHNIE